METALTWQAAIASYDGVGGASLADLVGLAAGSCIATPAGDMKIEDLRAGDTVLSLAGAPVRVTGVTTRRLTAEALVRMPEARAVRFAPGLPRPLLLAPGQIVLIDGTAAPAAALINGRSIDREIALAPVHYVRLCLETPTAVLAEGIGCATAPVTVDIAAMLALRARLAASAGLTHGALDGNIATLDHDGASGWVMDKIHPDIPVAVEFLVEGEILARTLADRRRPDLEMAGLGNGQCGFAVRFRRPLANDRDCVVRVRRIDDGMDMPGSPLLLRAPRGDTQGFPAALRSQCEAAGGVAFLAGRIDRLLHARAERQGRRINSSD